MRTALICNRWTMEFEDPPEELADETPYEYRPFLYQIHQPRFQEYVSTSTSGGYELLKDLPPGQIVVEFFGGVGLQSLMVEKMLVPERHVIVEKDPLCVEHLRRIFTAPHIEIHQGDARDFIGKIQGDIYLLDCNGWSLSKLMDEWLPYLDALFASEPEAISWYDTSKAYFGVNRQRYSERLGEALTDFSSYGQALSRFFQNRWEHSIAKMIHCSRPTYFLAQPWNGLGNSPFEEITIPKDSGGFAWKK